MSDSDIFIQNKFDMKGGGGGGQCLCACDPLLIYFFLFQRSLYEVIGTRFVITIHLDIR